jgi:hypothetical protein
MWPPGKGNILLLPRLRSCSSYVLTGLFLQQHAGTMQALAYESLGWSGKWPLLSAVCNKLEVLAYLMGERNLDKSYRYLLLVIRWTSVNFCGYLISGCVVWRCTDFNKRIFLVLILTEVHFNAFKSLSNNVSKKFILSPFTYEGIGQCTCSN